MPQRWSQRPEGSNWGDFGPDDQLGRLNLMTPGAGARGGARDQEGITFCLSLPLDRPGGNVLSPSRYPPVLRPTLRNGRPRMNYRVADDNPDATDLICDDAAVLHTPIFHALGRLLACRLHVRRRRRRRAGAALLQRLSRRRGHRRPDRSGRGGSDRRVRGEVHFQRQGSRHRGHGGQRRSGARRDDRPATATPASAAR